MNLGYLYSRFLTGVIYHWLYRKLHPGTPKYSPGAISRLRQFLAAREAKVFEWGSGRSTIWYALRASQVVAVEHDAGWHKWVEEHLVAQNLVNAECRYIPPLSDRELNGFCWKTDWRFYGVLGRPPGKPRFRDYIAAIDEFEDESFDLIAIDGRERVGRLVHAVPKLKPGGMLLLDDSNRQRYAPVFDLLDEWPTYRFPFGLRETSVFLEPAGR